MAVMKIQDGASVTSQLRFDSSNGFISGRLISGASFMFISSIVSRNGGGGGAFDATPPPSPGTSKKAQSE